MNFGDLNIPSSRAFWDDYDEDEFGNAVEHDFEPLKLAYQTGQTDHPIASDLLLCIEGPEIALFAEHSLLRGATKICSIPAKQSSLHCIEAPSSQKILIAVLNDDLTNSGEVTELLLPYARLAKNVITLSVKAKVEYKSENYAAVREVITFIRGINTQNVNWREQVKPLRTPNFIAGVAAGIASWRDGQKLPVCSLVAYTDNVSLDAMAAAPILTVLQDMGLQTDTTYVPRQKSTSLYL